MWGNFLAIIKISPISTRKKKHLSNTSPFFFLDQETTKFVEDKHPTLTLYLWSGPYAHNDTGFKLFDHKKPL
jgi:hypothetical protein